MSLIKRGVGVLGLGLLGAASLAHAGVTSTVTLTNDYDFRGFTQSAEDPAIQASVDYAHESGFYLGAWGSNIDFGPAGGGFDRANLEVDVYAGFTKALEASGVTYDLGLITYNYPDETDYDYVEVYGSVAKDWFKGKLWYSPKFGGNFAEKVSGSNNLSAWYLDFSGTFPLPQNVSLLTHVGYSTGDYWDNAAADDVLDYSIGIGYTWKQFNFAAKYVDQSTDITCTSGTKVFCNEGRAIISVATTFPWKKE
jgi:uncharacterized protein (TIGR02001 family)